MDPVVIQTVSKAYGSIQAVSRVSLTVPQGTIFALLGPNGAGKTTLIRMLMGILPPDEGELFLFGRPPTEAREQVGYLPEARGLYRQARVDELLTYLGSLKGLSPSVAHQEALMWLERMNLAQWARSRIHELSHGMQQKVQLIAALLHRPPLIVFDEPFQGLDPINVQFVKDLMKELRDEGRTLLLSSHQLHHVEALADEVALIHQGRIVEAGPLDELKKRYARGEVCVRLSHGTLPQALPGVQEIRRENGAWRLIPRPGTSPHDLLRTLMEHHLSLEGFEVIHPSLEDIFLQAVQHKISDGGRP